MSRILTLAGSRINVDPFASVLGDTKWHLYTLEVGHGNSFVGGVDRNVYSVWFDTTNDVRIGIYYPSRRREQPFEVKEPFESRVGIAYELVTVYNFGPNIAQVAVLANSGELLSVGIFGAPA